MVGAVLGLVVAVLNLAGMWAALRLLSVHSAPDLPWTPLAGVVATCAVLAVTASVIPAGLVLRRHAAESAGVRE
ncbi:hypothetical protein FM21_26200 [Streptomyces mutabilis]|uniref:Uncharacterized protein n=1 Tax=Streptomyces mutabilis TaxID=67332 RepID=A0A086MZD9_9ACTN|nr:hypothetical protein FM21_26200 [Streptomyces mutabilis]